MFAIGDCLREHEHDDPDTSSDICSAFNRWEFRPGASDPITRFDPVTGEGFEANEIRDMPVEALIKAGDVLNRYLRFIDKH